jgi:hypothetical protein
MCEYYKKQDAQFIKLIRRQVIMTILFVPIYWSLTTQLVHAETLLPGEIYDSYIHTSDTTTYNNDAYFTGVDRELSLNLLRINTSTKTLEEMTMLDDNVFQHSEITLTKYKEKLYAVQIEKKNGKRYLRVTSVDEESNLSTDFIETIIPTYGHRRVRDVFVYGDKIYVLISPPTSLQNNAKSGKNSYIYSFDGSSWSLAKKFHKEIIVSFNVVDDQVFLISYYKGKRRIYHSIDGSNYSSDYPNFLNYADEKIRFIDEDYIVNHRNDLTYIKNNVQVVVLKIGKAFMHPLVTNGSILALQIDQTRRLVISNNATDFYNVNFSQLTSNNAQWSFYTTEQYGEAIGVTVNKDNIGNVTFLTEDGLHWYELPVTSWTPPRLYVQDGIIFDYGIGNWILLSDTQVVYPNISLIKNSN